VAFPPGVHKLVFGGPLSDGDQWQMGLHLLAPGQDLGRNQTARDHIKDALRAWWLDARNGIGNNALLRWAKCNALDANGRYANPYTNEWVLVNDGGPGLSPAATKPGHPHLSLAVTLRSASQRGQATRGRVFPPAVIFEANAAGKVAPTTASGAADAFATLLSALIFNSEGKPVAPVIVSKGVKAREIGAYNGITRVQVGDEIDVQQRRRRAKPEAYSEAAVLGSVPTDAGPAVPTGGIIG
jgi:hypothetical protein